MIIMSGIFVGALMLGIAIAPQKVTIPQQAEVNSDTISLEVIAVHDDTNKLYRIDAEYPQFHGSMQGLNGAVAAYVNEEVANFKTIVQENWKARQDTTPVGQIVEEYPTTPFTFSATWAPKQLNKKYISVIVRADAYEGGAHGRSELRTFNYDMESGRLIELGDLFPGRKDYLSKIAAYARERLIENLRESSGGVVNENMVAEGTAPVQENFKNFLFDENVIEIYFPKYQVAPGVAGEQRVFMPRQGVW